MAKKLIGETLGPYQITEQIGKGGMATIYKAFQPSLEREVAIKILPPYYAEQDETFISRFKREAKAIANLQHQNILMVMDTGLQGDYFYIVMEYVPAGTLKDLISDRILSLKEISKILGQLADALDYAHRKGIVHRDIKPSNILMRRDDWALLTDFGLAKMVGGSMLTQSGMTVGTPAYMSPEQGSGAEIDSRTDIYSLGVMLYEMVIGEVPYMAETPMAVVIKHITEPLPMPRAKKPNLPEEVQRIILKALAKKPEDRYQTAGDLAEALRAAAQKMPDWSSDQIPTVVSGSAAPQDSPSAPTIQPQPEASAPVYSPPETLAIADSDATLVAGSAKRNPWMWATIAIGAIAVLLLGIFGTMAFLNRNTAQRLPPTPPPTQQDQAPSNDGPADSPGGLPENNLANGSLGSYPLPVPPPEDVLNFNDPWDEGLALLDAGDFQKSRNAFYQALRAEPFLWEEFLVVVDDAYYEHGPAAASALLEFGLMTREDLSEELDDLIWMADMKHESGEAAFARHAYAYTVAQDPDRDDAYLGFYYTSSDLGKTPEGIQYLQNLADAGGENPGLFTVLGYMYSETGNPEKSVEMQQHAVELDPSDPWLFVDLAQAYLDMENEADARAALASAKENAALDPSVLDGIGWVYMDIEAYAEAEEAFRQEIELMPEEYWGYLGLVWALLDGDQSIAEIPSLIEEAYTRSHDDPWLLVNIGWIYEDLDNCNAAIPYYQEALTIDPNMVEAEEGLEYCSE